MSKRAMQRKFFPISFDPTPLLHVRYTAEVAFIVIITLGTEGNTSLFTPFPGTLNNLILLSMVGALARCAPRDRNRRSAAAAAVLLWVNPIRDAVFAIRNKKNLSKRERRVSRLPGDHHDPGRLLCIILSARRVGETARRHRLQVQS
jgi:hypothetical protein